MIRLNRWGALVQLGWLSLSLLPLSLGLGRYWPVYIAHADGLLYQFRAVALYPADALVVLTCLGWLAWRRQSGPRPRLPEGITVALAAVALLAAAAAASVASADDRALAVGVAVQLAVLVVFYLAAAQLLASHPPRLLLMVVAVAVIGEALIAVWQAAAQTTAVGTLANGWARDLTAQDQRATVVMLPVAGRWLRSYGTFAHPNILGMYIALSLAVLAIGDDPRLRRLRAVALAAGFAGLVLTFSRAAGLAVLLGGATWLFAAGGGMARHGGRARFAVATAVVLLALVALVRVGSQGSLIERNSIETRLSYNALAWEVIARGAPVGAGNHVLVEQRLFGFSGPAHDVFLIALAELGPFGLVAWLSILGSLLFAAWQRRADHSARTGPLVAAAVLSPLLLLDHYLWTQPPGRVLSVWALALLMSLTGNRATMARAELPTGPARLADASLTGSRS